MGNTKADEGPEEGSCGVTGEPDTVARGVLALLVPDGDDDAEARADDALEDTEQEAQDGEASEAARNCM